MLVRNKEIASLKQQFLSYALALFGSCRGRRVAIKQLLSCRQRSSWDNPCPRELMALLTRLPFM